MAIGWVERTPGGWDIYLPVINAGKRIGAGYGRGRGCGHFCITGIATVKGREMLRWLILPAITVLVFVSGCMVRETTSTTVIRESTTVIIAPQEKMGNFIGDI